MASPLHDNKRSKELEGDKAKPKPAEGEKKAEEKPAGYIAGEAEPGATTHKRDEMAPAGNDEVAVAAGEAAPAPKDMFMDGMKAMRERHLRERRDAHGAHKKAIESMGERHEKEFTDHYDLHFKVAPAPAEAAGADADAGSAGGE